MRTGEESAQSRGFSKGQGQGQTAPRWKTSLKGPRLSLAQRGGHFQRRAEALLARKPAPASPVTARLPLQLWAQPGPADPDGRERGQCLPSPARSLTSMGLGGTF